MILIHESEDGTDYVSLPSYAEMSSAKIVIPSNADMSLGGTDTSVCIEGRGNAIWYGYGKRPYPVTFSSAADLLGMDAATSGS